VLGFAFGEYHDAQLASGALAVAPNQLSDIQSLQPAATFRAKAM
jgi:hypothetical protein